MKPMRALLRRIARSRSGLAMTEFALAAPLLMTAGLYGTEVAWLALTHLKISQTAMQIADNGSRIGDTSMLEYRRIYESDLNDVFQGADLQAGPSIDLFNHGRVIISSLEVVPGSATKQQYIHWQRCMGAKDFDSTYGVEGAGLDGSAFDGMGPAGNKVTAYDEDDAVIFVEISYDYEPLFGDVFVQDPEVHVYGAFNVRDSRDLTQIYQRNASDPDPVASCDRHEALG
ncbi:TadE/TadG family type IV pilus assembly protein [Tsuneonella sp. HG222]